MIGTGRRGTLTRRGWVCSRHVTACMLIPLLLHVVRVHTVGGSIIPDLGKRIGGTITAKADSSTYSRSTKVHIPVDSHVRRRSQSAVATRTSHGSMSGGWITLAMLQNTPPFSRIRRQAIPSVRTPTMQRPEYVDAPGYENAHCLALAQYGHLQHDAWCN